MIEESECNSRKADLAEEKAHQLQSKVENLQSEKKLLADKLEEATKRLMASEAELEETKTSLQAEQDKVVSMEVKLAEAAQQRLYLEMMEKELGLLRRKVILRPKGRKSR